MAQAMMTSETGGVFDYNLPGVGLTIASVEATFTTGRMYYFPIRVADPINVSKLGILITLDASAGMEAVFGIYSADVTLTPDGASLATITLPIDTAGDVASGALDIDLDRGTYLVSMQVEETIEMRCITGTLPDAVGFTYTFQVIAGSLYVTRTYDGTNPSTGPAFTTGDLSASAQGGFDYPFGLEFAIL